MNEQLSRRDQFVLGLITASVTYSGKTNWSVSIQIVDELLSALDRTAKPEPEPVKSGWVTVRRPTGADGNKVGMVLSFYCNQVCMTKWSNVRDEPWMPLPLDYTGPETGEEGK